MYLSTFTFPRNSLGGKKTCSLLFNVSDLFARRSHLWNKQIFFRKDYGTNRNVRFIMFIRAFIVKPSEV